MPDYDPVCIAKTVTLNLLELRPTLQTGFMPNTEQIDAETSSA